MRARCAALALVAAALTVAACDEPSTTASPSAAAENLELRLQTQHFRVFAAAGGDALARAVADRLESDYARIVEGFGVGDMPAMAVRIWQDEAAYYAELTRYFGVRYTAVGYLAGAAEIRVLAVPQLLTNVVHEFVHAATLAVNPSFANNPRWLWEAVALYENGELVDPRRIDYLARGAFPTLAQLNADPNAGRQIYEVGYLLGDFIVTRWGRPAWLRLIQASGDLPSVLGVSTSEFEAGWQTFVRQKYFT